MEFRGKYLTPRLGGTDPAGKGAQLTRRVMEFRGKYLTPRLGGTGPAGKGAHHHLFEPCLSMFACVCVCFGVLVACAFAVLSYPTRPSPPIHYTDIFYIRYCLGKLCDLMAFP